MLYAVLGQIQMHYMADEPIKMSMVDILKANGASNKYFIPIN